MKGIELIKKLGLIMERNDRIRSKYRYTRIKIFLIYRGYSIPPVWTSKIASEGELP